MPLAASQPVQAAERSAAFYAGRKLGEMDKRWLWNRLQENAECPSRVLCEEFSQRHPPLAISPRHLNRLRVQWGLNRPKGRPRKARNGRGENEGGELIQFAPQLSFVGVHLLAHWLEQEQGFEPVIERLEQAIEGHRQAHPDDDFALLHHRRATLLRRFQALFFAPLFGIERLTEFDTREHPLASLIGRGYLSSTLNQFLSQLERIEAAEALMPALVVVQGGRFNYVDGHMIAYWNRVAMHKGNITMLGRIMAGSQAVISHNETGQAVYVEYYPPDIHLSQVIVEYCQQVAVATASSLFVIDRAVNSVALAGEFAEQGLGLLSMLDDNEHQGRDSFEATLVETLGDGTKVYSGQWKQPRPDDRRHFAIAEPPAGKTLVYWATPAFKAAVATAQWPQVYRERNEIQENSFKRMIEHGALNTNYGRKKIIGPDRHQQRKQQVLDQAREATGQKLDHKAERLNAQQDKVAESVAKGHAKRLEQRQRKLGVLEQEANELQRKHDQLTVQAEALGPPGQRADRDFRKQTIMTFRTLLLENALGAFLTALCAILPSKVSLESLLGLLFERSGARVETHTELVYWVNTAGLSLPKRRLLGEIVEGLGGMGLNHHGKPIRVCLRDRPP